MSRFNKNHYFKNKNYLIKTTTRHIIINVLKHINKEKKPYKHPEKIKILYKNKAKNDSGLLTGNRTGETSEATSLHL